MKGYRFLAGLCAACLLITAGLSDGVAQNLTPYRDWFGSYGFTDSAGNIVIDCRFDDVKGFSEGYAPVLSRSGNVLGDGGVFGTLSPTLKWGFIDTTGMIVIPCQFDLANQFSEGFAAVMSGNRWGFIDGYGDTLVTYKYDEVKDFVNGYAAVRRGQFWGYIDTDGQEFVPCMYNAAGSFASDGFAAVTRADSSGYVFRNGSWYATKDRALNWIRGIPFSIYARDKVMNNMNQWQRKAPGESVQDWEVRVNEETFMSRIEGLEMRSEAEYLTANSLVDPEFELGDYDSLSGTFAVRVREGFGDGTGYGRSPRVFNMALKVAPEDAASVYDGWKRMKARISYFVHRDRADVASVEFTLPGKQVYSWTNPFYSPQRGLLLNYDVDDVDFSLPGKIYREMLRYAKDSVAVVDVDARIPSGRGRDADSYAIVIGNCDYMSDGPVPYASEDCRTFYRYCTDRLGIPEGNIRMAVNASSAEMASVSAWLDKVSRLFNADTRVILYFSGKCAVDDGLREPYLLPVDYMVSGTQSGIGLNTLYRKILGTAADNALFIIDASYGGIGRDGMHADVFDHRPMQVPELQPEDRMVVLYAAGDDDGAYPYPQMRHGLFTYFLLKALMNNPDEISYGALFDYVRAGVEKVSAGLYGRKQSPEVYSSRWDGEAWRDFTL
ncbi:MAG TPA: WG repeat-containing protein [Candidatus Coprenecus pullistercoris]|nr:WG repeat-containing protein [Candidatus Coprenecus pullistercoris]